MRQANRQVFMLAAFAWLSSATAQGQPGAPWPLTQVDSVASVRMPYQGSIDEEIERLNQGLHVYSTSTSDNEFDVVVFNPQSSRSPKPGPINAPDMQRYLNELMKLPNKQFSQAKLKSSHAVTLPSAPGSLAVHQVYSGFDDFHQQGATMELTWVASGSAIYVFRCSYQLPEEQGSAEDRQHFFSSIAFKWLHP